MYHDCFVRHPSYHSWLNCQTFGLFLRTICSGDVVTQFAIVPLILVRTALQLSYFLQYEINSDLV